MKHRLIDPQHYVVRLTWDEWTVIPFGPNVVDVLEGDPPRMDREGVRVMVGNRDVSVVSEPSVWEVQWMLGGELDETHLLEMTPVSEE